MSLIRCLPDLIAAGKIDPDRAKEVAGLYGELERVYKRQFGEQTAAAMASEATLKKLAIDLAEKKRRTLLQINAQQTALKNMKGFNGGDGRGPIDPAAGQALFDRDPRAGYSNIEARRKAVKGRAHAYIDELLAQHHKNLVGAPRDPAGEMDLAREAFGEDTGNANAKELAGSWGETSEYLRQRRNAAGGNTGKMDKWGLPQSHNWRAVREAGFESWRNTTLPLLDRARMIDDRTGAPFSDGALELAMRDSFEKIRSDGMSSMTVGGAGGGKMLAKQRDERRFFQFKDADSWLAYRDRFGSGTAFDAMLTHIDEMSREIAAMEILGPNPAHTVTWIKDSIEKSAGIASDTSPGVVDAARAGTSKINKLWNEYAGINRRPENRKIALTFGAIRSLQSAAKLGSAFLSAIPTDPMFGAITRRFNGLPVWKEIGGYASHFLPFTGENQKQAVRAGLIAEEWSNIGAAQNRYLNEEITGEWSRRLAAGVLKVSGLERITQAGRWAFGMEYLSHLTSQAGKSFDELEPATRGSFRRYGISSDDWDAIRATPLQHDRGAEWLYPKNVEDQALGDRLLEMIHTEVDFAVPVADLKTRALMSSVAPRGTLAGELVRSALLFKSFGISVMLAHGRRILEQSPGNAARYAAGLFILTTLGGAMAVELKELDHGRDPRSPTGDGHPDRAAAFWGAAALQGGGWGIFGDFFGASQNRFGGGLAQTAAGPLAQTAQNLGGLTFGNAVKAFQGKKTTVGRDAVSLLKQETPGGSLWYARLAFERLVADQLQEAFDPDYRSSWRRMKERAKKQGQGYYWEPGQAAPERAPEF